MVGFIKLRARKAATTTGNIIFRKLPGCALPDFYLRSLTTLYDFSLDSCLFFNSGAGQTGKLVKGLKVIPLSRTCLLDNSHPFWGCGRSHFELCNTGRGCQEAFDYRAGAYLHLLQEMDHVKMSNIGKINVAHHFSDVVKFGKTGKLGRANWWSDVLSDNLGDRSRFSFSSFTSKRGRKLVGRRVQFFRGDALLEQTRVWFGFNNKKIQTIAAVYITVLNINKSVQTTMKKGS